MNTSSHGDTNFERLADYFNEHVFYEVQMLAYSKEWLEKAPDQATWNVMFAAFNVSARNLYYFVGRRDGDNANVADYRSYCQSFQRGSIDGIEKILVDLNAQCLHLGKKRQKDPDKKITLDKIRKVSAWLVSNMDNLLQSFTADFRSRLRSEWAGLVAQLRAVSGPIGPGATLTTSTVTGPTGPWSYG